MEGHPEKEAKKESQQRLALLCRLPGLPVQMALSQGLGSDRAGDSSQAGTPGTSQASGPLLEERAQTGGAWWKEGPEDARVQSPLVTTPTEFHFYSGACSC